MPRIIKDLDIKILQVAERLFKENDYEDVDMRLIAKEVGIAVGTLYNYYSNKESLYLEVYKYSWNETLNKIDEINKFQKFPKEKLKKFLFTIYKGKKQRKYLCKRRIAKNIFIDNSKFKENKKHIHEKLISKLFDIINELREMGNYPFNNEYSELFVDTLLMFAFSLTNEKNDDEIINFIDVYIDKLFNEERY